VTRRTTTVRLDEKLMTEVHAAAQRSGLSDDEVIEQALRRFVGLEVLDELWSRNRLSEAEAMEIATSELRALRSEHKAS
jgi:predicted transcriptional regulator